MKIIEFIQSKEIEHSEERLAKLEAMNAPMIVIETLSQEIGLMKSGHIKIGGDENLLNCEFTNYEVKQGCGGKVYIQFDGKINYFPNAKYGRFICLNGGI